MKINITQIPFFQLSLKTAFVIFPDEYKISTDYKCKPQQEILKHISYWGIYVSFHLKRLYHKNVSNALF